MKSKTPPPELEPPFTIPHADASQADLERRLRTLSDTTFHATAIYEQGILQDTNAHFCTLFRCDMAQVAGRLPITALIAPESMGIVLDHIDRQDDTPFEAVMLRLDGTRFMAEIRSRSFPGSSQRSGIAVIRDISERKQTEARTRLFLEIVADLSQAATQEDIARIIVTKGMRAVGGHLCTLGLTTADGLAVAILQGSGVPDEVRQQYHNMPLAFPGPLTDAARTGQPVWIETQDEYVQRYPHLADTVVNQTQSHATACLPLEIRDRVIGAIGISFATPRRFEQADHQFLLALTQQTAQALERARLYEAERLARARAEAAVERMARLQQVMTALSGAITPQEVARVIVSEGINALDASAGSIAVLDEADTLVIVHMAGYAQNAAAPWRQIPLSAEVPLAACVRSGRPVWLASRDAMARAFPLMDKLLLGDRQAWAALPLIVDGRAIGVLGLGFATERAFEEEERLLMQTLAGHCAQALERARLYEAEATARTAAERANALKTRFFGMISHELRTPLASIKGFASTLLATDVRFDEETQQQYIGIIDTETNKLTALVEQLLDLSRLQAGTLPIQPQVTPIAEILEIAAVQMKTQAGNHPLEIAVRNTLPPVLADAERIAQVIVNLVDNAAKYSPDGKPIKVSAKKIGDRVEFRVADRGAGIPANDREFIFGAFQQLERKSGARRGAGLGLAICKGLIEAHGGHIWVVEKRSGGTTIAFTLPVAGKTAP